MNNTRINEDSQREAQSQNENIAIERTLDCEEKKGIDNEGINDNLQGLEFKLILFTH